MIPAAGRHGGDGPAIALALSLDPDHIVDLSMTLNPCAPDITALARRHLGALRRYPSATAATAALADAIGTDPGRLLLTNGGSEAISLVAGVLGGTVAAEPEFALHPRGGGGPRWRSNPNNPTGRLAAADERADVWDEAFFPLATGRWTRGDGRAVVVGSLTKVFACPGLRLGYVLADDIDRFAAAQPTWPVNGLALAVLPELLAAADLRGWQAEIAVRREQLASLLGRHGIPARPSDAPWLIAEAPGLREHLAPAGVVVRDCASFGLPGHVRVAVPDDAGFARLSEALSCVAR
ncbi:MAG: aminotransferase class I/II-fold pyridoxal phosphate-dependent enzyme [Jatrophihabitans sp.]